MILQDYFKNEELYSFYCKVSQGDGKELCGFIESFCNEDRFKDMIKSLSESNIKELENTIYIFGSEELKAAFNQSIRTLQTEASESVLNEKILREYLNI